MTTDDQKLTEQIARALTEHWKRKHSTLLTTGPCSGCARVVLPIIRKAERDAARAALDGLAKRFDRMGDGADQADQWAWEWHAQDETERYRDEHYPEETP